MAVMRSESLRTVDANTNLGEDYFETHADFNSLLKHRILANTGPDTDGSDHTGSIWLILTHSTMDHLDVDSLKVSKP